MKSAEKHQKPTKALAIEDMKKAARLLKDAAMLINEEAESISIMIHDDSTSGTVYFSDWRVHEGSNVHHNAKEVPDVIKSCLTNIERNVHSIHDLMTKYNGTETAKAIAKHVEEVEKGQQTNTKSMIRK